MDTALKPEDILYVQEHMEEIDKTINGQIFDMTEEPLSLYSKDWNGNIRKLLGNYSSAYLSYAFARQYGASEVQARYYSLIKNKT